MLSGYLLCDCIYKTERLLKTALITLFYSTIGLLLGLIVFNDISVIDIIKSFFLLSLIDTGLLLHIF